MNTTNSVQLIGHIGQTPKMVTLEGNQVLISFSLATNYTVKKENNEKVKYTEWHNCVAFGSVASLINYYLKQGSYCLIHGSLRTRTYDDKAGVTHHRTEIVIGDVLFLDKPAT